MRRVVPSGELRQPSDGNKRYRPMIMDFDARANTLSVEVHDDWEPSIREQWVQNKASIQRELMAEFGQHEFSDKLQNFIDLGMMPFSVISYHNNFLRQARSAFVMGSYYPSLVGACALGERILNHLVINLRDEFKGSPHYKHVYRKKSFDNWPKMIEALKDWDVLLPDAVRAFTELNVKRNDSVHFRHDIDRDARTPALDAIRLLQEIVSTQFSALGGGSWFIPETPGEAYLKPVVEALPFIRVVLIPNCFLVSRRHQVHFTADGVLVTDEFAESARELTDEEFALGEY